MSSIAGREEYLKMLDNTIELLGPANSSLRAMLMTTRSQYENRERIAGEGLSSEALLLDLIGVIGDLEARIYRLEHALEKQGSRP